MLGSQENSDRDGRGKIMTVLTKFERRVAAFAQSGLALALVACATVKVEAPDKPIEINLNVKIDQEVRIKMDKDVEDAIANNPNLF
jgi:hypothetical protein